MRAPEIVLNISGSSPTRRELPRGAKFFTATLALGCALALAPVRAGAQQTGQKTYPSADAAAQGLYDAVSSNDEKKMLEVLGPHARKVVNSGDDVEDEASRTDFTTKYTQMHRTFEEPDGTITLYIGAENWPTPIPIVKNNGVYFFDTDAARDEILYRRIGQNELSAIRVCEELASAQKEYYAKQNNVYAAKFVSDDGTHDGLYWLGAKDQYDSPIGPLIANAGSTEGTAKNLKPEPTPFHGYYFRILSSQGKSADGGAMDYTQDGKMTRGFAFVAFPAAYRDSGVMTFIVSSSGVVYQKDLGKRTAADARAMRAFDPDTTWSKADQAAADATAQSGEPGTASAAGAETTATPKTAPTPSPNSTSPQKP
jgi:Protein of unknown function (DUF2950)